jgi:hypothetical protein
MSEKHYYLFGLRVWSIIVEVQDDAEEEIEENDDPADGHALSAAVTLSADDRPGFGFTPWTPEPWGDWED